VLEHRVRTGRLYQPGTIAARVCKLVQGGDQ
jgi:hypothetical protein